MSQKSVCKGEWRGWVWRVLLRKTRRSAMMHGKGKSKAKRALCLSPPSEAAHSSDIWVAHMKGTRTARHHADSAAGYCLSNTLCYSENIVIHLRTLSVRACARALAQAVGESCRVFAGAPGNKRALRAHEQKLPRLPPLFASANTPRIKAKLIPGSVFSRVSGLSTQRWHRLYFPFIHSNLVSLF